MENLLLSCIESRVENNRSFYGRFQLGPFDVGQGLTVANALRRTLLSELKGLAITSVKIDGASHEYSSLKGVRESVLNILLNLKQIVFTTDFPYKEPQIGYLDIRGPAIVTSSDLKLPISIQCVDPEQYIATLSHDGVLRMKFLICQGNSYVIQTPLELTDDLFNQAFPLNKNELQQFEIDDSPEDSKHSLPIISKFALLKNVKVTGGNIYIKKIKKQLAFPIEPKINLKNDQNISFAFSKKQKQQKQRDVTQNEENKEGLPFKVSSSSTRSFGEHAKKPIFKKNNQLGWNENITNFTSKSSQFQFKNTNSLPIDAVFMPVNKVNFLVENDDGSYHSPRGLGLKNHETSSSQKKKEKIILEIWTNGSIHPRQAIHEAAKSLICLFFPFQEARSKTSSKIENNFNFFLTRTEFSPKSKKNDIDFDGSQSKKLVGAKFSNQVPEGAFKAPWFLQNKHFEKKRFSIDIGNLDFSLRPYTCLKRANINTVGDLLQYSSEELLLIKNFGKRSLEEVEKTLAQMNLKLRNQNLE